MAPRAPAAGTPWRRREFAFDLNLFIALWLLALQFAGVLVYLLPHPAGSLLVGAVLAACWWRYGLSPRPAAGPLPRSFAIGHGLLALANVIGLAIYLPPLLGTVMLPQGRALAWAMLFALTLWLPVGVVGLLMVFSVPRRTADPAFADTRPLGAPPAPPPAPPRLPGVVGAVLGLVVSSLLVAMSLVFAATGFVYRAEQFTHVVLPVAGTIYAAWLLATLVLLVRGRLAAAAKLAWSPLLLMLVLQMAGGMLAMLLR